MRQEFPTIEELEDVGAKFLYYTAVPRPQRQAPRT